MLYQECIIVCAHLEYNLLFRTPSWLAVPVPIAGLRTKYSLETCLEWRYVVLHELAKQSYSASMVDVFICDYVCFRVMRTNPLASAQIARNL